VISDVFSKLKELGYPVEEASSLSTSLNQLWLDWLSQHWPREHPASSQSQATKGCFVVCWCVSEEGILS
jgi:hypothetical protein